MVLFSYKRVALALIVVLNLSILLVGGSVALAQENINNTYYLDNVSGNDANDGKSTETAWKTLARINETIFQPNDKILLKSGGYWEGQLVLKGSGSEEKPIVLDRYGEGNKPIIEANGKFSEALLIKNVSFWEINNLELTNQGEETSKLRTGVHILSYNYGEMKHIHIKGLYVHDVNGNLVKSKTEGCGIYFEAFGKTTPSRFYDLLIEDNFLKTVDRNGIAQYVESAGTKSENVAIRGNRLEDIGGDGIKLWGTNGGIIEKNVIMGCSMRAKDPSAGIWPFACNNTIVQYNEVAGVKKNADGQAFDADYYTTNTLFQYNYSHDNEGGFMLLCSPGTAFSDGTVVRYNISENDGMLGTSVFHFGGKATNCYIYNNIIYQGKHKEGFPIVRTGVWDKGKAENNHFYNNIFYIKGELSKFGALGEKTDFSNNVFYGKHFEDEPADNNKIVDDPKFVAPGGASIGMDTAIAYKLMSDSPCIGKGMKIDQTQLGSKMVLTGKASYNEGKFTNYNPNKDFYGNSVSESIIPDIGAHQYSNDTVAPNVSTPLLQGIAMDGIDGVSVSFTEVDNADGYTLVYGTSTGFGFNARKVTGIKNSPVVIDGFDSNKYMFKLSAQKGNDTSYFSAPLVVDVEAKSIKEVLKDALVLVVGSSNAYSANTIVKVDKDNKDVAPIIIQDRVLVPVRFISENVGAQVQWDAETATVTIKHKDSTIKMRKGEKEFNVNEASRTLDVPVQVINGRTLVPLRAIVEALGKKVFWDSKGLIVISDKENTLNSELNKGFIDRVISTVVNGKIAPAKEQIKMADVKGQMLKIVQVSASQSPEAENKPQNVLDGNFDTRWSAQGKQWFKADLGIVKKISTVCMAFFKGNERSQKLEIEVSEDGENWKKVYTGMSSGKLTSMEKFPIDEVNARYVRINVTGTTKGDWNSISELQIYGE